MPASVNAMTADKATAAPESAPRLSVSLVGRLGVRFNGRPIELRTRKAGAVLSYLALSEAKQESRERLVGLLWSRSDEEKARASLRQVVRELRSMLEEAGYDGFVAERLMIGIDVGRIEVDIESVIQLAESGRVHPLLLDTPQLDGRLLEGMDDLDPSFRVWVLAKRQTIHERLMRNLDEGLTSAHVAADAKKRIAAAIVNLDPTHEHACRYLMRAHAEEGDVAGALRIYKALWDLLDRDYAMEPSAADRRTRCQHQARHSGARACRSGRLGSERRIRRPDGQGDRSPAGGPDVAIGQCIWPGRVWCCGPLRCMASMRITAIWCRGSRSILPPVSFASANGAWSIVLLRPSCFPPRARRRNTASRPPPTRPAPKSIS